MTTARGEGEDAPDDAGSAVRRSIDVIDHDADRTDDPIEPDVRDSPPRGDLGSALAGLRQPVSKSAAIARAAMNAALTVRPSTESASVTDTRSETLTGGRGRGPGDSDRARRRLRRPQRVPGSDRRRRRHRLWTYPARGVGDPVADRDSRARRAAVEPGRRGVQRSTRRRPTGSRTPGRRRRPSRSTTGSSSATSARWPSSTHPRGTSTS